MSEAHLALSRVLLELGFYGEARYRARHALTLAPGCRAATSLYEATTRDLRLRERRAAAVTRFMDYRVRRYLGTGWEGAAYAVKASDGRRSVLKIFHPEQVSELNYSGLGGLHREQLPSHRAHLLSFCDHVSRPERPKTLYRVSPVFSNDNVVALEYPLERLFKIARPAMDEGTRLALLGAYCRTQAYLLETAKLCLVDVSDAFMVNMRGHPRYIDYGLTIIPIDDFRCGEEHRHVRKLIDFLFWLWDGNAKPQFDGRQVDARAPELPANMPRSPTLRRVFDLAGGGDYAAFVEPGLYQEIACSLPDAVGKRATVKRLLGESSRYITRRLRSPYPHRLGPRAATG